MSCKVNLRLVDDEDKYTQKCNIPVSLLKGTNLKIGDFVAINCVSQVAVCRLFPLMHCDAIILLDDVVTCFSNVLDSYSVSLQKLVTFPDDFSAIQVTVFNKIKVKLVQSDGKKVYFWDKTIYQNIIRKILHQFVVGKNSIVKCCGLKLADLFYIENIVISETYEDESIYGRLSRTADVEITDVYPRAQMCQMREFAKIKLGGMKNVIKFLKINFLQRKLYHKILITGPSGCGKSSLVKKLCCDGGCFLLLIDGMKESVNKEKYDVCYEQLTHSLVMFPERPSVLFIDHIDQIAPYDIKSEIASTSLIMYLIRRFQSTDVLIIAATMHKAHLHPVLTKLFDKEVILTIPTFEQRKEIFQVLTKPYSSCKIECDTIARMTPGFIGLDISLLVKEAANISKQCKSSQETNIKNITMEDFEKALLCVTPSVLKTSLWNLKVKPVYWKDIGGMSEIKKRLQMCIEWPLCNPDVFHKVNLPCPHGVLLFGPPGCCKTTLARGLATACNANFFAANPAQIYSAYVGESEKNITELFYHARLSAPSIIFLDELDSLVCRRKLDSKAQGIGEKVLSTLLNEMDGFGTRIEFQNSLSTQKLLTGNILSAYEEVVEEKYFNDEVIVVAATNRPDLIDDALLRPGRFDVILYVPPPNTEERKSILQTIVGQMPTKPIDFDNLAQKTELFSGADLKNLCNEAAMNALREDMSAQYITEENFKKALENVKPSITRKQIRMYEQLSSKYGPVIAR